VEKGKGDGQTPQSLAKSPSRIEKTSTIFAIAWEKGKVRYLLPAFKQNSEVVRSSMEKSVSEGKRRGLSAAPSGEGRWI